jgi:hypothetical protein
MNVFVSRSDAEKARELDEGHGTTLSQSRIERCECECERERGGQVKEENNRLEEEKRKKKKRSKK